MDHWPSRLRQKRAVPCTECLDLLLTRDRSTERSQDDVGLVQATTKLLEVMACCSVVLELDVSPASVTLESIHLQFLRISSIIITVNSFYSVFQSIQFQVLKSFPIIPTSISD